MFQMLEQDDKRKKNRVYKKSSDTVPAFLLKTYDILDVSIDYILQRRKNPQYESIISWNEEGNAFVVKKINEFSEQILPKYFKHSNFASFVRQLNMYDFHKTRHDNNENEFKHKLFRKGYRQLLNQIKRKSTDQQVQELSLVKTEGQEKNIGEFKELVTEMAVLANKQSELEKLIKIIIKQNEKFQKENKYLWNELIKHKLSQKNEAKNDKMVLWFLQQLTGNQSKKTPSKNSMLMLKDDEQSQNHLLSMLEEQQDTSAKGTLKQQVLQGLLQHFGYENGKESIIKRGAKYLQDQDMEEYVPLSRKKVKEECEKQEQNQSQQLMVYQQQGFLCRYPQFDFQAADVKQEELNNEQISENFIQTFDYPYPQLRSRQNSFFFDNQPMDSGQIYNIHNEFDNQS